MIDLSDGSQNLRVDESVRPADLGFWFGRGARPGSATRPTFGQMIGARNTSATTLAPQAVAPAYRTPATMAPITLNVDSAPRYPSRPDIDGARQYLSPEGWNSRMPPTAAHQAKIHQYLLRAGWDGKSEPTQELKDKAYQLSRVDVPRF